MTIREAVFQEGFQLISGVSPTEEVVLHSAVIGRSGQIVNRGDYVSYEDEMVSEWHNYFNTAIIIISRYIMDNLTILL